MSNLQSFACGNQSVTLESQDWDSEILQRKCGRILKLEGGRIQPDFGPLALDLEKRGFEYVTIRWPQQDRLILDALIQSGFEAVDGIIALKRQISAEPTQTFPQIRLAQADDAKEAAELAARSFRFSRFHNDPAIFREQADKIHYEWAWNSCLGKAADAVLLWIEDNKIAGFSSIKVQGNEATIVLVCVGEEFSGRGIAAKLTAQCCEWMRGQGIKTARVQTQANNIAALTVYKRCGFEQENLFSTLRWAKGQVPFHLGNYATGAFLALETSFFTELGKLAESLGANIEDVWRGAGSDARIGAGNYNPLHNPHLEEQKQDLQKLLKMAQDKNFEFKLLEATVEPTDRPGFLSKILAVARWPLAARKNSKSDL